MFDFLKRLLLGRPEKEEEKEFRRKAHRSILASAAGLSGLGKVEEEKNERDKVCSEDESDG